MLVLQRYFVAARKAFANENCKIFHVAVDGARAGGRDSEIGCIWCCGAEVVAWLPPMAPGLASSQLCSASV
eukprot:11201592-Lingulodinium_polyedra.AAC.1